MVLHLILTTLSGEEAQLTIELQEFDRLQEFEREQLPETGNSSTFGCELDFLCCNSQQKLVDPIWHTLRDCNCFTVVVSPCLVVAEHKGQIQGEAKALRVPFYYIDRVFPQAFSYVAKVRHIQVDAGYRIIGKCSWHHCQHLQMVHLASTVISLQTRAFYRCYALQILDGQDRPHVNAAFNCYGRSLANRDYRNYSKQTAKDPAGSLLQMRPDRS